MIGVLFFIRAWNIKGNGSLIQIIPKLGMTEVQRSTKLIDTERVHVKSKCFPLIVPLFFTKQVIAGHFSLLWNPDVCTVN